MVTARHYARWCGTEDYRATLVLRRGEVPADLLARLPAPESPPESPRAPKTALALEGEAPGTSAIPGA